MSPLFIGLTIVGFGTSTPELGASLSGSGDVAVGNVVGSNIFNIAVILGLTAVYRPIRIRLAAVRRDLLVAIVAAGVPWLVLATGGTLPRWLGLALLAILGGYAYTAYRGGQRDVTEQRELADRELTSALALPPPSTSRFDRAWIHVTSVAAGLAMLVFGSQLFVGAALALARDLGVSELVIGLTIVAAGTSLPELVTSIVAALRNSPDIAVGNVIGSNIFNVFGILGLCSVVTPQAVNAMVLWRDTPIMLAATLALIPILRSGGVVSRWEGGFLLAGYVVYIGAMWRVG